MEVCLTLVLFIFFCLSPSPSLSKHSHTHSFFLHSCPRVIPTIARIVRFNKISAIPRQLRNEECCSITSRLFSARSDFLIISPPEKKVSAQNFFKVFQNQRYLDFQNRLDQTTPRNYFSIRINSSHFFIGAFFWCLANFKPSDASASISPSEVERLK